MSQLWLNGAILRCVEQAVKCLTEASKGRDSVNAVQHGSEVITLTQAWENRGPASMPHRSGPRMGSLPSQSLAASETAPYSAETASKG